MLNHYKQEAMKKTFALLIMLATALSSFAQDTITGVVNRIAAPYFEQNVCDTRFAITTESETYYVMVDNYWPNPYLEDLVIHYDTIAIGNEIEVVGEIKEMEDQNGEAFSVIDISKYLNSDYQQILGFFYYTDVYYPGPDAISAASFVKYNGAHYDNIYNITINDELQTEKPLVINGRTLVEDMRYMFIGKSDVWTDYNGDAFNVFEIVDALPYYVEDISIDGTFTTENDLCLTWPQDKSPYLSVFDGELYYYLTNNRVLQNDFINDVVFMEGDHVTVDGFEIVRYDLFGIPFKTLEIINMLSSTAHTLIGVAGVAGIPYTNVGPPIPGICLALISDGIDYYIRQPQYDEIYFYFDDYYVVGNDTIHVTEQQLTASCYPGMFINNYIEPEYTVIINQVEFDGLEESYMPKIQIYPNSANGLVEIVSEYSIKNILVYDCSGRIIHNKSCNANQIYVDLPYYKGLAVIQIIFENGLTVSRKVVVK